MIAIGTGVIAAFIIIVLGQLLRKMVDPALMVSACLVAIAFIYVGFSLEDNRPSIIVSESALALVFYFMAMIGYTNKSALAAVGIILHGVWDACHHHAWAVSTTVPAYWPTFCCTVDIIDGVYFYFLLKK